MMKKIILGSIVFLYAALLSAQTPIHFNIDVTKGRKPISPFIYGTNTYKALSADPLNPTITRFGGNRTSTYNWETNWSNAGSDYIYNSDTWWLYAAEIDPALENIPGSVIRSQLDSAKKANRAYMVTLQALGYVSADKNGPVSCDAPCNRWIPVYAEKPGHNYQYPPDKTDNAVYADEEVAWLISRYGTASAGGIKYYQIDNEPELWNHTHHYIQKNQVTPEELAQKNEMYAKMIRRMDPSASIMGYVSYGWWGLVTVDLRTYLKEMKTRSDAYGKPLIDLFDWHFYPNDLQNFTGNKNWDLLQAPRVLWDANYFVPGGGGPMGYYGRAPQFINRYNTMIQEEFPGLKMSISEWNASFDETSVFTGLYVADILGVYGQENIEAATYFDRPTAYAATGFRLFTNYDGNNSTYGDTYVQATTSDLPNATVYASTDSQSNDNTLHVVVIAKDMNGPVSGTFTINGTKNYNTAEVYYFDGASQNIIHGNAVTGITGNTFSYTIPRHSAVHFVLTAPAPVVNLTAPATGSEVCKGTAVPLKATAGMAGGTIRGVEFYDGANLLGTATAAPYAYTWTNAGTGIHSITAKAISTGGNATTSSVVSLTVKATPAAPTAASAVSYCQNTPAAALTATGESLQWYAAATGGTAASAAPVPATTAAGAKEYFVSQTVNGCESPRAKLTVTVKATPAAPTAASAVSYCQNTPAAALTATGESLQWYAAATGGTAASAAPVPATTAAGTKEYFVSQTVNGCESPRAKLTVTVHPLPTVTVTPDGPATFAAGGHVTLNAPAGSMLSYQWYQNGTVLAGSTQSAYIASAEGQYSVEVMDANSCKNTSSPVSVTVNPAGNELPVVQITAPAANSSFTPNTTVSMEVDAFDADGSISKVEFYSNGLLLSTDETAPYSFDWTVLSTGDYAITAKAYDDAGSSATSTEIIVHVSETTGISQKHAVFTNLFPNPSSAVFNITPGEAIKNISVFTMYGTKMEETGEIESGKLIQIGNTLDAGIYILLVEYASGTTAAAKIIKEK